MKANLELSNVLDKENKKINYENLRNCFIDRSININHIY
jgi:hypothetical protein